MSVHDVVATAPVFAGLDPAHLEAIASFAAEDEAEAGTYLMREGTPADRFHVVRSGSIALEVNAPSRGPVVIETLHRGDVVGLSWLLKPYRVQFDARVVQPVTLLTFDVTGLRRRCEESHDLGYALMGRLAAAAVQRLHATRLQLLDVYANPAAR